MTSWKAATTEGKANGDTERVELRGLFGTTRKQTILVPVSNKVLIAIADAIAVAVVVVSFCSCVVVVAPRACETRVEMTHPSRWRHGRAPSRGRRQRGRRRPH